MTRISPILLAATGLIANAQTGPATGGKITAPAARFDLRDVKLLDGPFKTAMELNATYLLSLEPDRLLSGVRRNAGLEPKAPTYGGWESQGVAGQSLGHYMTALAQQYRATGDRRFLERVNYIVDQLAECQAKDPTGYVAAIPNGKAEFEGMKQRGGRMLGWVPWYTMHKLFQGLRDARLLCDNKTAETVLIRLTDWADHVTGDLTPQELEVMLSMEHGGMPETLADVYAMTGNPQHLALARRFCHHSVMDPLAKGEDRLNGLHANTQIPKIVGAARLYELTGEPWFRDVAVNFWNTVVKDRTFALGGNSDSEHFFPPDETHKHLTSATAETCNTYNMLRLSEHLAAWQPDGRWMDYYERALYNHILASQDPRTGMFTYFVSLKPGHFKVYSTPTKSFWCCVGTGMENHSKYGEAIYAHGKDTLWINLFMPSVVNWREKNLVLKQETRFPERDTTRLTVECRQPQRFAMKIRAPFWLAAPPEIRVNGETTTPESAAGYLTIEREWHDGDTVDVRLPMALRSEMLPHSGTIQAILYGPVLLAAELGRDGMEGMNLYLENHGQNSLGNIPSPVIPRFVSDAPSVLEHVEPVPDKPLTFRTKGLVQPSDVTLIPFYRMHHQRYSVYFETFTSSQWTQRQAGIRAEEQRQKLMQARTTDEVRPGEQQSEVDHAYHGASSQTGEHLNTKWRDARDGGWLEYTLKTDPAAPMEMSVKYWGDDGGRREFDLLADGVRFSSEKLNAPKPGEFIDMIYPIPAELTRGKSRVTIRFQAKPGNSAGGLFGIRMLKQSAAAKR